MNSGGIVFVRLGARIRRLRETQGRSQEDLADAAGIHRTYLGGIERGTRNPSVKNLSRIARALDVSIATLFSDDDVND